MHTYIGKDQVWTVGHYQLIGYEESSSEQKWIAMRDFSSEKEAAAYVSFLNGGDHPLKPWPHDVV